MGPRKRKMTRFLFSGMNEAEESQAVQQTQHKGGQPLSSSYCEIRLSCRDRCLREISLAHDEALRNILEPSVNKILSVADQKGETLPTAVLTVTLSTVDRDEISRGIESLLLHGRSNLVVSTLNCRSCPSKARAIIEARRIIKEFENRASSEETCGEDVPAPLFFTTSSSRLVILIPEVERMDNEVLDSLVGELTLARRRGVCVSILLLLSPLVPFPVDALCRETSAFLRVSHVGGVSTRQILYAAWGNLLTSARLPFVLGSHLLKVVLTSFDSESGSYITARDILTLALERHIMTSSLGFLTIPECGPATTSIRPSHPIGRKTNLNEVAAQQPPPPLPLWNEKRLADCFHWAGKATMAIAFLIRMAVTVNPDINPISVALKYYKAFQDADDILLIRLLNECRDSFLGNKTTTFLSHGMLRQLIKDGLLVLLSTSSGLSQLLHATTRRNIIGNAKVLCNALNQGEDDQWIRTHIQVLFFSMFYCSRRSNQWQNTEEWKALCCNGTGLFLPVVVDGGEDCSNNGVAKEAASTALFFQPRQMIVKELQLPPPRDVSKDCSSPEDIPIAFSCLQGSLKDSTHVNEWFQDFSNALLDNNNTAVEENPKKISRKGGERKGTTSIKGRENLEEHAARFKWACESLVTQLGLVKRRGSYYHIITSAGIST